MYEPGGLTIGNIFVLYFEAIEQTKRDIKAFKGSALDFYSNTYFVAPAKTQ